jgi:hypothetical protein
MTQMVEFKPQYYKKKGGPLNVECRPTGRVPHDDKDWYSSKPSPPKLAKTSRSSEEAGRILPTIFMGNMLCQYLDFQLLQCYEMIKRNFETGSCYVSQIGLVLGILLPQLPKCWDYSYLPPHPVCGTLL